MKNNRTFGLDNYDIEARQYFAMAPIWDRVDPLAEKYYGISPYVYCAGNPVNNVDKDGKMPTIVLGALTGAGLDYAIQVVEILAVGKGFSSFTDIKLGSIAISAASGAVGAGIVSKASKFSNLLGVANDAVTGAALTMNDKLSENQKVTARDLAKGAMDNTIFGVAGSRAGREARNRTKNSVKQKFLERDADRAKRKSSPLASKPHQEAAKKTAAAAKQNIDNKEVFLQLSLQLD